MSAHAFICGEDGQRADVFLARASGLTRSRVAALIAGGAAAVDGHRITKPGHRLKAGDAVFFLIPPSRPAELEPQDIPLTILYEDEHILVLDKPSGMVVHPSAGHDEGTLVHALLHHCTGLSGIGGVGRPGIVHRLDRDTTGGLVVAKNDAAHLALSGAFARREVLRVYLAMVHGTPARDAGRIDAPIGRHPLRRQRMAVVPGGREAVTRWRVLLRMAGQTLIACRLETGRTHQIRVHMASIGHPVVGDPTYGHGGHGDVQRLHAWILGFTHPVSGQILRFRAPLPGWVPDPGLWQSDEEDLLHDGHGPA